MERRGALLQLPAEILIMILCRIPDVQSFESFVTTCRSVHGIYTEHKIDILCGLLGGILHVRIGVAVEAEVCAAAEVLDIATFDDEKSETLRDLIDSYRTKRAQQLASNQNFQDPERVLFPSWTMPREFMSRKVGRKPLDQWPARDLDHLLRLFNQQYLLEKCVNRCVQLLLTPSASEKASSSVTRLRMMALSRVEERRLYRAFYRFQLYHILFDKTPVDYGGIEAQELLYASIFPSHEIEEIGVVYQWLCDEWHRLIHSSLDIFHEACTIVNYWTGNRIIRDVIIAKGLQFFVQVVMSKPSARKSLIEDVCSTDDPPMHVRRFLTPHSSPRAYYRCHDSGDGLPADFVKLTFSGDHPDCPNAAWLWTNNSRMTPDFFREQDVDLRKIGYVMWDKDRLSSWSLYNQPRHASRSRSVTRER